MKTCCICGKEFDGYGNNALPIKEGTCCDECNSRFVIPLRISKCPSDIDYKICRNSKTFHNESQKLRDKGIQPQGILYDMSFYNDMGRCVVLIPTYEHF